MNKTKIAAAQLAPFFLNKEKTVAKACDAILEAGKNGAQLVVFPEVFIAGYPDWVWLIPNSKSAVLNELYVELVQNAVAIPDESTQQLCRAAKSAGIHVAIGMHERNTEASQASLFNTLLFISDQGKIIGKHRKMVPTGGERLIWAQGDGSTLPVLETPFARLAGLTCWENYMPLARNAIYAGGTQILAAPTWDKSENWLLSLKHIAREGGLYIVSCCMALHRNDIPDRYEFKKDYPADREWINHGNSCIVSPKGEMISGPAKMKEEIIYAEIDLNLISESKRMFDAAGHYARPDVFKFAVNRESNNLI